MLESITFYQWKFSGCLPTTHIHEDDEDEDEDHVVVVDSELRMKKFNEKNITVKEMKLAKKMKIEVYIRELRR